MLASSRQPAFHPLVHSSGHRQLSSPALKAGVAVVPSRSKEAPMEFEYDRASGRTTIFAPSRPCSSPPSNVNLERAADVSEQTTEVAGSESGVQGAGRIAAGLKRSHSSVNAAPETDGTTLAFGGPFMFSRPSTAVSSNTAPSANFLADGVANLRFRASGQSPPEPLAGHALKKVLRKRAQAGAKYWRVDDSDEDDDGDGSERDSKNGGRSYPHEFLPSTTSRTTATLDHHSLPYVISGYLQLTFNVFVVAILGYLAMVFIRTVQRDVDLKVEEYSAEILQEMSQCSKRYLENKCTPGDRVPAMDQACRAWESCMNRDPTVVGRAKVSAETFAEIINSFVEPISYKTMAFCIFLTFGSILVSNLAFGFYRSWSAGAHNHIPGRRDPRTSSPPPAAQIHVHSGPPPLSWNSRRYRPRAESSEVSPKSRVRRIAF